MKGRSRPKRKGNSPADHARAIDKVCDEFEAALVAGKRPRIEDYLGKKRGPQRSSLLRELMAVKVEHRLERGEQPTPHEYRTRFPKYSDLVETVFKDVSQSLGPSPPTPGAAPTKDETHGGNAATFPTVPGHEILGLLGRGGMGVVYKARNKKLDRTVALKMILAGDAAGPSELERFRTEAKVIARQRHPNIVQIFEVGEHEGRPYLSLEFVEGGRLDHKLDGKPQPERDSARMVETLARAIHHAHGLGIIHRDLKPANILLTADGEPKVSDFGLAKKLGETRSQTKSGDVLGTPAYMAPEQASGETRRIGPPTDVYGLGAILYEILTGRPPFHAGTALGTLEEVRTREATPLRRLVPKIHRDLETICLKCLQKEPEKRYSTAATLADDLKRFLDGETIHARPVGLLERSVRWARRRPAVSILSALLLVAVLVIGAVIGSRGPGEFPVYQPKLPLGLRPFAVPVDNPMTAAKVALGRRLFFDRRLSVDDSLSCASCHDPERGWSNGKALARGVGGKFMPLGRSAPSLINVAYNFHHFWDGREDSLEGQALRPILNPTEMAMPSLEALEHKLNSIVGYRDRFREVFGTEVTGSNLARSLAAFERTLLSGDAPYDRYRAGDKDALSEAAERGMQLFFNDAQCSACHGGDNFTDGGFHNIGTAWNTPDRGRQAVTGLPYQLRSFKTPALRDVARTGPYMHNGSLKTLEDVVEYYNNGGNPDDEWISEDIKPLELTIRQKQDLVAFLKEGLAGAAYPEIQAPELPGNEASRSGWILGIAAILLAGVIGVVLWAHRERASTGS